MSLKKKPTTLNPASSVFLLTCHHSVPLFLAAEIHVTVLTGICRKIPFITAVAGDNMSFEESSLPAPSVLRSNLSLGAYKKIHCYNK